VIKLDLQDKNILITGGAGFIGSQLAKKLIEMKANITIFDNFITGHINNLKNIKNDVILIKDNVKNYNSVLKSVKNKDIVVHMAFPYAKVSQSVEEQFIEDSYIGTFNVLKASLYENIQKVVYGSSVAVYGQQEYLPLDEEHPKSPNYPYGVTKFACENLCKSFSKSYDLDTVSLRYFNVYGPFYTNLDHSAVLTFMKRVIDNKPPLIYGDGIQIRDYTYISDIVEGTIFSIVKNTNPGDVFNLGSGNDVRIIDLAQKIIDLSHKRLKPRFAKEEEYRHFNMTLPWGITKKIGNSYVDTRSFVADISKARKKLDYSPKISLDQGLKLTFNWIKNTYLVKKVEV
jgi:UDP-glucose 4-epimerase